MKKKFLLIGLSLLLLLVGGVGAKTFLMADAAQDEAALAKEPGIVYPMAEPFVVNLADGGQVPRYAKVGIALRVSKLSEPLVTPGKGDKPAHVEDDAQLRDIIISTLQRSTSGQLSAAAGREKVKRQIVKRVNMATELKILEVYYTEFAVQ